MAGTFTGCITLTYERPGLPFDSWKVRVNGEVVYQESEDEEETDDGHPLATMTFTRQSPRGTDRD